MRRRNDHIFHIINAFQYKFEFHLFMMSNIEITDLSPDAMRQYINSRQTFTALREVVTSSKQFRGGMVWREQAGHTYLIRTSTTGSKKA